MTRKKTEKTPPLVSHRAEASAQQRLRRAARLYGYPGVVKAAKAMIAEWDREGTRPNNTGFVQQAIDNAHAKARIDHMTGRGPKPPRHISIGTRVA